MKNLLFILCSSFILLSCKSELEKIDIDNVEGHIAYHKSKINSDTTVSGKYLTVKKLIAEYKLLDGVDLSNNENYNYYLSTLYGTVSDFPLKGFWVDTVSNSLLRNKDYSIFYDSSFFYAEKSLKINKNNIRAMFVLSKSFFFELSRYGYDNSIIPFSFNRDSNKWNDRHNFILNNALRFQKIDTTADKYLSRGICEVALHIIDRQMSLNSYKYDRNNDKLISLFNLFGKLWDVIKNNDYVIIDFDKEAINNEIYPLSLIAQKEIERKEMLAREQLEKQRIKEERIAKLRNLGAKYLGSWESDYNKSKIYIYNDGTYKIVYTNEIYGAISRTEGYGTWDCTENTISFTTTSGESVATMYSAFLGKDTVTFQYYDIFAPTLCLNYKGHVDFCFNNHNK